MKKVHGNTGRTAWNKGLTGIYTAETLQKMSEAKKDFKPWNTGKKYPAWSARISAMNKLKIGPLNPNWRNGATYSARLFRKSAAYKHWRRAVLKRDERCVWCGATEQLEVDHINAYATHPEQRLDINNGRVLCRPCHKTTPSYGATVNAH